MAGVEGSEAGAWDWDLIQDRLRVSTRWCALRGITPSADGTLPGSAFESGIHPEDRERVRAMLDAIRAGRSDQLRLEYRVATQGDRHRWAVDRARVLDRDAAGRPRRLAGLQTDVTLRKDLEHELGRTHRLLETLQQVQRRFISEKSIRTSAGLLLDAAVDVTESAFGFLAEVLHDDEGRAYMRTYAMTDVAWNAAARSLLARHAANGLEFHSHRTLFGYSLRTGEPLIANDPSTHPERGGMPPGHPSIERYAGIPVYSGGRMVGLIGLANRAHDYNAAVLSRLDPLVSSVAVMIDAEAAERQRSCELLRRLEATERLHNVTRSMPGAVLQWRTVDRRLKGFAYVSEGIRALTSLEPDAVQVAPRRLLRAVERTDLSALLQAMRRAMRLVTPWTCDLRLRHVGDPDATWCRLAVQPRRLDARSVEWTGVLIDVQENKRLEEALRRARDDADAGSRAKSAFLASMSHEIRTPIHAMLGYLELLQQSPLQPAQKQQIGIVADATHALKGLLDDVLDFSRIEAGKTTLYRKPVHARELIASIVPIWSAAAEHGGLQLIVDNRLPSGTRYLLDPLRIREILTNLLSNAIKFTRNGTVTVRAEIGNESDRRPQLRFEVADTGIGIPITAQQRIFQPFEQENGETTRRYGGSGLGLAISRGLAQLMDGELTLDSQPGVGTTVRLTVPAEVVAWTPATENPSGADAPIPQRGLRVLVAEDNTGNRELLSLQLEHYGAVVVAVSSGRDALAAARASAYDLILTDCHMPDMDGFTLARALRDIERAAAQSPTPIVAFTADAQPETEQACRDAGMDGHVAKPIGLDEVRSALCRWGSGRGLALQVPTCGDAPSASPIIDRAALDRVTGGITWLRRKALSLFAKNLPPELARLDDAIRVGDPRGAAEAAHSLTGAARTIGATVLAQLAEQLTDRARGGDELRALRDLHGRLVHAATAATTAAQELLDEPK